MLARRALGWAATALVGVACALVTYLWLPPRVSASGAASRSLGAQGTAESATADGGSTRTAVANGEDNATTRKAVVAALLRAHGNEPEAAADPSVKARETFDQRMADAAPDAANTARMEQAIEAAVASGVLGATRAEKVCGATLCRVDLANADAAQLNQSISALSDQLPKLFVRSLVIPTRNGERALYLSTDPRALSLAPPSERHIFVPAPTSAPESGEASPNVPPTETKTP